MGLDNTPQGILANLVNFFRYNRDLVSVRLRGRKSSSAHSCHTHKYMDSEGMHDRASKKPNKLKRKDSKLNLFSDHMGKMEQATLMCTSSPVCKMKLYDARVSLTV